MESDWNRGNPTKTQTLSPEVQGIIDSLVMDRLQGGRSPYGMPDQIRDIYGGQSNWQRERFGLPPADSNPSPYGNAGADSFTGGNGGDSGSLDDYNPEYTAAGQNALGTQEYQDAGLRNGTYDEFSLANNRIGQQGSPLNNPFADTYNASEGEQIMGMNDIGSLEQLLLSEQGGNIGAITSALTGVPFLGRAGRYIGDRNIANGTWMSPVDANNPYQNQSPDSLIINELVQSQGLPRSGMNEGDTNYAANVPRQDAPRSMYGNSRMSGGGGRSIAGNGMGYATRINRGGSPKRNTINPNIYDV